MGGHWELNVGRALLSYAQPGMTALDVGAHFGYYTVKLCERLGPGGRLFAFEPNPEVNSVCLENIKINGLMQIATLHKVALGDIETSAILTRSSSNMASANLVGEQDADYSVTVPVRRLDDLISPSMSVDLIKLDAEGYEKRILDGAVQVLARSPQCAVMIELGLDRWERSAQISELVPSCGGNKAIYAVHDDGRLELFSPEAVKPFLEKCAFKENYFFVAQRSLIERHVGHLVIHP